MSKCVKEIKDLHARNVSLTKFCMISYSVKLVVISFVLDVENKITDPLSAFS